MNEGKRCSVCKKEWNEVELFEGISGVEMVMVCGECSGREGIPTIRKPTNEQIKKSVDSRSVRERMERISGVREATEIGGEQEVVQRNLHKLRVPPKKETNPFVVENHYWIATMGRRRKKLTLTQASEAIGIDPLTIEEVEHGKIPEDFDEVFDKMEKFYGIKLLKNQPKKIHFIKTREEEEKILEEVEEKISGKVGEIDEFPIEKIKENKKKMIERGEIDFSDKGALEDITLNDLVEMKGKKKRIEEAKRIREEVEGMVGEDLELELGGEDINFE
jgi:transcriptional regulator with XRE-family HTH domain